MNEQSQDLKDLLLQTDEEFHGLAAKHHELEGRLQALGVDATLTVHPGTGHAFMAPHNALGTQDNEAYARIWPEVVAFLHEQLG